MYYCNVINHGYLTAAHQVLTWLKLTVGRLYVLCLKKGRWLFPLCSDSFLFLSNIFKQAAVQIDSCTGLSFQWQWLQIKPMLSLSWSIAISTSNPPSHALMCKRSLRHTYTHSCLVLSYVWVHTYVLYISTLVYEDAKPNPNPIQ